MNAHFAIALCLVPMIAGAVAADEAVTTQQDYLLRGKEIAMQTGTALGGQLQQAMRDGGPVAAVEFCNENAQAITGDMAKKLGSSVVRVSDRPRNPGNAANAEQLAYIAQAKTSLAAGQQPKPAIMDSGEHMVGYYPIVSNGLCLQCHGTPGKEISEETRKAIETKYPMDQAMGYGPNELRGIFVVTMAKH